MCEKRVGNILVAPCGEASVALKNVTAAQFKANLAASFVSGIAADLKVTEDLVVVTSVVVTASNSGSGGSTRRRVLLLETASAAAAGADDVLAVVGM